MCPEETGGIDMLRRLRIAVLAVLAAALVPSAAGAADGASLVEVDAGGAGGAIALEQRGLDVVEIGADKVEVIVHTARDEGALEASGYDTRVLIEDLDAANRSVRAAEQRAEASGQVSSLPTGRVAYRTLDEINAELRRLAAEYPDEVRLIRLRERSLLGHSIFGVEISHDVRRDSGKAVFLNTGVHHAREWPTAEFVLEFAWEVLREDGRDPRITSLLERGKMIAVPVVNPDGYDISRRLVQEQKRKNCRIVAGEEPTAQECEAPANANFGVDPNRNYGAFWGGPGSSASRTASNHRGEGPWSEPEIRNMRALATANQVTVAINNHTPDERLLRAPSSSNEPVPADVVVYDALAQLLGDDLNWPAGPWTEIYYEASGTAEQTAYYGAGTLAFTPEATPGHGGAARFHPPYEYVVDQYLGADFYAGSSIRRAFLTAFDAAVDPGRHSVISGQAPRGIELTIAKSFSMDTSNVDGTVSSFPITYRSRMVVPESGRFEWHVNPSVRPSQYASEHLPETWTISCGPGNSGEKRTVQVTVRRGEQAAADLSRCPPGR
jgi:carboxypeptidase T